MSIPPTPYESFSTSNRSIVPSGAWSFYLWALGYPNRCKVGHDPNDTSDYDIECNAYSPFLLTVYNPTLEANISINLANHDGATTLNFTWTCWPVYFTQGVTSSISVQVHSQVGDAGFDDSSPSVPAGSRNDTFIPDSSVWNNSPKISHSGYTSVVRGSDPNIGYISLQINVTMSSVDATVPNPANGALLFWVKDIGFNITTPPPAASSSSSSSPSPHIGVIVGATVGVVVFITLIVIAIFSFRRRRERANGHTADSITFTQPVNHYHPDSAYLAQPTPVGMVEPNDRLTTPWTEGIASSTASRGSLNKAVPSIGLVAGTKLGIGTSGQHSSSDSNGLPPERPLNTGRPVSVHASFFSAMPDYSPLIYGLEDSVGQDGTMPPSFSPHLGQFASTSRAVPPSFSPELARYASANRDVINQSLEARLQAAGYLPTDDPSDLTPEYWKNEHGVNMLELNRLKNLYARNR